MRHFRGHFSFFDVDVVCFSYGSVFVCFVCLLFLHLQTMPTGWHDNGDNEESPSPPPNSHTVSSLPGQPQGQYMYGSSDEEDEEGEGAEGELQVRFCICV